MLVTVGVGVAAINTGSNLLFLVLGLLLSMLILSGVLSDLVVFWVRPTRILPARAHAKTPFLVEVVLFNEKRFLPSFSIEVEDEGGAPTEKRTYFLRVEPRGERRAVYERTAGERGLLELRELVLRTSYPFGLVERTVRHPSPALLVVYPELEVDRTGLGEAERQADAVASRRPGQGGDVLHLREYQPGEPARVEAFERRIRRLAWIATTAHARGADVTLTTTTGRSARAPSGRTVDPVLAFLAVVQLSTREEVRGTMPEDAERALARAVERA